MHTLADISDGALIAQLTFLVSLSKVKLKKELYLVSHDAIKREKDNSR